MVVDMLSLRYQMKFSVDTLILHLVAAPKARFVLPASNLSRLNLSRDVLSIISLTESYASILCITLHS